MLICAFLLKMLLVRPTPFSLYILHRLDEKGQVPHQSIFRQESGQEHDLRGCYNVKQNELTGLPGQARQYQRAQNIYTTLNCLGVVHKNTERLTDRCLSKNPTNGKITQSYWETRPTFWRLFNSAAYHVAVNQSTPKSPCIIAGEQKSWNVPRGLSIQSLIDDHWNR